MNNWFAAAAAGVLAVIGGMGGPGQRPSTTKPFDSFPPRKEMTEEKGRNGSSTRPFGKGDKERNASSTKAQLDMACVSAAATARESALASAIATYNQSVSSAYTARASALTAAYSSTDTTTVKTAVKSAWTNFKGAMTAAKKGWQNSRDSAWSTYKSAIKSCGSAAASVADTSNQGSEAAGQ